MEVKVLLEVENSGTIRWKGYNRNKCGTFIFLGKFRMVSGRLLLPYDLLRYDLCEWHFGIEYFTKTSFYLLHMHNHRTVIYHCLDLLTRRVHTGKYTARTQWKGKAPSIFLKSNRSIYGSCFDQRVFMDAVVEVTKFIHYRSYSVSPLYYQWQSFWISLPIRCQSRKRFLR